MGNLRSMKRRMAQQQDKQIKQLKSQAKSYKDLKAVRKLEQEAARMQASSKKPEQTKKKPTSGTRTSKSRGSKNVSSAKRSASEWLPLIWILAVLVLAAAIGLPKLIETVTKVEPKQDLQTIASSMLREDAINEDAEAWAIDRYQLFVGIDAMRDHEAPVITGVQDRVIAIGSTVLYKEGVSAQDNFDGEVRVSVDASEVKENEEGTYTVTYSAVDEAGNESVETAQFTFVEPNANLYDIEYVEEGYDEAELPVLIAQIYGGLCSEDMSQREKAEEIYAWVYNHIGYSGVCYADSYDESNMAIEAVAGLHRRSGNCFTYTSITKALLDMAGIDSIVVRKIEMEGRSDHFWVMVCIDEEWWHFDTTPRAAGGYFCLWSDEEMLEYSEIHNDCFDFDLTLYPRTPGMIAERFLVNYPELMEEYYPSDEE